jgi:dynactin complex subunit
MYNVLFTFSYEVAFTKRLVLSSTLFLIKVKTNNVSPLTLSYNLNKYIGIPHLSVDLSSRHGCHTPSSFNFLKKGLLLPS